MDGRLYLISKLRRKVYSEENFATEEFTVLAIEDKGLPEEFMRRHPEKALRFHEWPACPQPQCFKYSLHDCL